MPSSDTISCWFLSSFVINWVTCQITGNWHVNQLCIICSILIANWSRDQLCINRSESTGKKFSSLLIDNGSESNLVSSLNNIIDNWSFYSKFFVLAINWPIFTEGQLLFTRRRHWSESQSHHLRFNKNNWHLIKFWNDCWLQQEATNS